MLNLFIRPFRKFIRPIQDEFKPLQTRMGYHFKNPAHLKKALSHRSYVYAQGLDKTDNSNERLEFLGDAVLDLVITHYLFETYPDKTEGVLSKVKSLVVSARVLALCAQKWELGQFIYLSQSEAKAGGAARTSILADTFEAVLGAMYLDGGLKPVTKVLNSVLIENIDDILADDDLVNYKSKLLEKVQGIGLGVPEYRVLEESGPEHRKSFKMGVYIQANQIGVGEGSSKKIAEQVAARQALDQWTEVPPEDHG